MRRFLLLIVSLLVSTPHIFVRGASDNAAVNNDSTYAIFMETGLNKVIEYDGFRQAMEGYAKIEGKREDLMVFIDFTKPSDKERFYIIDLKQKKILLSSHVAHGKGSGERYATSFSNVSGSYKSSLGFYLTANSYNGRNGYSLRLRGLEEGINDKAMERAIVIHGADYCDPKMIAASGRLGRSLGCPALPESVNAKVINTIKEGAVLFIYADNVSYAAKSRLLDSSDYKFMAVKR